MGQTDVGGEARSVLDLVARGVVEGRARGISFAAVAIVNRALSAVHAAEVVGGRWQRGPRRPLCTEERLQAAAAVVEDLEGLQGRRASIELRKAAASLADVAKERRRR